MSVKNYMKCISLTVIAGLALGGCAGNRALPLEEEKWFMVHFTETAPDADDLVLINQLCEEYGAILIEAFPENGKFAAEMTESEAATMRTDDDVESVKNLSKPT